MTDASSSLVHDEDSSVRVPSTLSHDEDSSVRVLSTLSHDEDSSVRVLSTLSHDEDSACCAFAQSANRLVIAQPSRALVKIFIVDGGTHAAGAQPVPCTSRYVWPHVTTPLVLRSA